MLQDRAENPTLLWMNLTYSINAAPTQPSLLSPANNTGYEVLPNFDWINSTDAEGDPITYNFQISNVSDFSSTEYVNSGIAETGSPTTEFAANILSGSNITLVRDGTYFWRVLASDGNLNSSWSEVRYFGYGLYNITFNLTDSSTGEQILTDGTNCGGGLCDFDITCNNGYTATGVENPYEAGDAFALGPQLCDLTAIVGKIGSNGTRQQFQDTAIEFTATSNSQLIVPVTPQSATLASPWQQGPNTIYNHSASIKLGIGTTLPTDTLNVVGTSNLTNGSDPGLYIDAANNVGFGTFTPMRIVHISDVMRLEPRSTAPSSPGLGDLYVDSDTNELCFYDGSAWTGLKTSGACA